MCDSSGSARINLSGTTSLFCPAFKPASRFVCQQLCELLKVLGVYSWQVFCFLAHLGDITLQPALHLQGQGIGVCAGEGWGRQ